MRITLVSGFALAVLGGATSVQGQAFQNLNFETTTLTPVSFPGGDRYMATLPGWSWNTPNYVNGDPNSVALNDIALDAPAVTLHGKNSPMAPALAGNYSVLLQGGTLSGGAVTGNTLGASIAQTGLIPESARSLAYISTGTIRVAFNGQPLPSFAIGGTSTFTAWAVDLSPFSGLTGELKFTAPWLTTGEVDGIRFSTAVVPEPAPCFLAGLGLASLWMATRRPTPGTRRTFAARLPLC